MANTQHPISRFADTVGDGTGSINANINSSGAAVMFKLAPPLNKKYKVERMLVYILDASIDSGGYGGNSGELTNGIHVHVVKNAGEANESIKWDITGQLDIIRNTDWKALCHDEIYSNYGSGLESLSYRYTFTKDGSPITLNGNNKEEIRIITNDDLTGLAAHTFRFGFTDS